MEVKPKLDFTDDGLEAKRDGWEENMVVSTMRSNKRVISQSAESHDDGHEEDHERIDIENGLEQPENDDAPVEVVG